MRESVSLTSAYVGIPRAVRLGTISCLVALAVATGALNCAKGQMDLFLIWLAETAYLAAIALPLLLYRRPWGWLHPIVFTAIWWDLVRDVLPRVGVYVSGLQVNAAVPGASAAELNWVVIEALLLKLFALVSFYGGFFACSRLPRIELSFHRPRHLRLKLASVAAISVVAVLVLSDHAGGVGQLLLQRGVPSDQRIYVKEGGQHWLFMASLLIPATLVWLGLMPHIWRRPSFLLLFATGLAINFVATGSRSGIVVPVLIAIALWMRHYGRVPYTALLAAAIFGVAVIGAGQVFRTETRGAESISDVRVSTGLIDSMESGFEEMSRYGTELDGTYGILARVPGQVPLLYGKSYLSILVAPFPRALLPFDKPDAGGKLNAIYVFQKPLNSIPPGNVGEAYWNFHVPGVVLVMALFGVLMRIVATTATSSADRGVWALYVLTIFYLQPNSPEVYHWLQKIVPAAIFLILLSGFPKITMRASSLCLPERSH